MLSEGMARQMLSRVNIADRPDARRIARERATREQQLVAATTKIADSQGVDHNLTEIDPETREEELLEAIDATLSQEFPQWWWDRYGESLTDSPEEARDCVALSADEWTDRMRGWHEGYHDRGIVDTPPEAADEETIRETAARHVEAAHGMTLDEFEDEVLDWDPREHLRIILAGPVDACITTLNRVGDDADR